MIWFVLAAVAAVICVVRFSHDWFEVALLGLLNILLWGLLACGINGAFYPVTHFSQYSQSTTQLVNIQGGHGANGQFFLGSGYVGDQAEFFYYTKDSNGIYRYDEVPAKAVDIHYSTETPHLVWHKYHSNHFWLSVIKSFGWYSVDIYIPAGSIKQNFTLGS